MTTLILLYHLLFPSRTEAMEGALARDRHPRLWELSRQAAVGTRPVDRISIAATPGIGVYEAGGFPSQITGRGRRILLLGLPSLHDLETREFAAILAHEYGHFRYADTR